MEELTKLLGKVAPWLAAAAAGPAGLAGMAVKTVAEALGASDTTVESVTQALAGATPEQIQALKLAELSAKLRLQELGYQNVTDLAKLTADDRADARKNNVASGMQDKLFWLSVILLGLSIGSEISVLFNGLPTQLPDMVAGRVLGFLDAITLTVLGYWFSTSFSSAQKTDIIAAAQPVK